MTDTAFDIRPADLTEADTLLEIIKTAFADHHGKLDPPSSAERKTLDVMRAEMQSGTAFVATHCGTPVACVLCRKEHDALHWERLAVLPSHRGLGLANQLMDAAEQFGREQRLTKARLEVRIAMTANRAIYAARGYQVVAAGTHDGYPAPTFHIMEKALTPHE